MLCCDFALITVAATAVDLVSANNSIHVAASVATPGIHHDPSELKKPLVETFPHLFVVSAVTASEGGLVQQQPGSFHAIIWTINSPSLSHSLAKHEALKRGHSSIFQHKCSLSPPPQPARFRKTKHVFLLRFHLSHRISAVVRRERRASALLLFSHAILNIGPSVLLCSFSRFNSGMNNGIILRERVHM